MCPVGRDSSTTIYRLKGVDTKEEALAKAALAGDLEQGVVPCGANFAIRIAPEHRNEVHARLRPDLVAACGREVMLAAPHEGKLYRIKGAHRELRGEALCQQLANDIGWKVMWQKAKVVTRFAAEHTVFALEAPRNWAPRVRDPVTREITPVVIEECWPTPEHKKSFRPNDSNEEDDEGFKTFNSENPRDRRNLRQLRQKVGDWADEQIDDSDCGSDLDSFAQDSDGPDYAPQRAQLELDRLAVLQARAEKANTKVVERNKLADYGKPSKATVEASKTVDTGETKRPSWTRFSSTSAGSSKAWLDSKQTAKAGTSNAACPPAASGQDTACPEAANAAGSFSPDTATDAQRLLAEQQARQQAELQQHKQAASDAILQVAGAVQNSAAAAGTLEAAYEAMNQKHEANMAENKRIEGQMQADKKTNGDKMDQLDRIVTGLLHNMGELSTEVKSMKASMQASDGKLDSILAALGQQAPAQPPQDVPTATGVDPVNMDTASRRARSVSTTRTRKSTRVDGEPVKEDSGTAAAAPAATC